MLWAAGRVSLPSDVAPGEIVSVIVPVAAVDGEGAPLAASSPGELWHYRVRWDAVEGEDGWFSQGTEPVAEEAIQVVVNDRGVRFESSETPLAMEAGATVQVPVVVANAGSGSWEAETSYLVARWYRWDGRDLRLEGPRRALTTDAAPGSEISLEATLLVPSVPGNYWLVWDMVCNGEGFASSQGGRRANMLVAPVLVRASGVRAVDLASVVNVPAVTSDTHRARGDFDGQGRTFPAEWMPPDRSGAAEDLYPSGYYSPGEAWLAIPFTFPDAQSGVGMGVACTGQSIPLGEQGVNRIHLLAASTAGARSTTFGLRSSDGETEQVELMVPSWTQPEGPARIGAYAPYVRTLTSDVAGPAVYLYHLTLEPSGGAAVSLELPREPWIRMLAITVEEAGPTAQ
ncbi:MAG: hypothetical protein IMF16_08195 [Proteobacteria bacterium]|nr:hypothetical protein [Pseudomonadota bacterium]